VNTTWREPAGARYWRHVEDPAGAARVLEAVARAARTERYGARDAFGNLAVEYGPAEVSPCGTANPTPCYVSVDHLGSTRMLMDSTGTVQRRYDYQPFGGELLAGIGSRSTGQGYMSGTPDDVGPKFTSQSRDQESTIDWFNVRYLSSAQGRFQSVDPGNAGAEPSDPQTWNMYAYVGNNPLSYTDPNGLGFWSDLWDTLWNGTVWIGEHLLPTLATLGTNQIFGGGWWGIGSGGSNSGPWSEQNPYGGGFGGLNTGTVFGSGDTGPFVNNILLPSGATSPADAANYFNAIAYLMRDPTMAGIIRNLDKSSTVYRVVFNKVGDDRFIPGTNTVMWDPNSSLRTTLGGCQSAALGLGHELAHADSFGFTRSIRQMISAGPYQNMEEKRVITGPEASAARTFGEPLRYDHYGTPKLDPTSTSRTCR